MRKTGQITLVTGGARSGKSALAERLAARHKLPRIYIATAQAGDDEMRARIKQHQDRRGESWKLIEEPVNLTAALHSSDGQGIRLVDCLTIWLANSLDDANVEGVLMTLRQQNSPVVLVTNELGQGIVPENALARRFRDLHGWMNQAVAGVADEVWMAVSGQPVRLKPAREDPDALF